ncbi:hypothetical protein N9X25_04445 [Verrucomicrobiales bacterium]|nr:hypothetical protein [Verrucomicrobiales bacterium]
MPYPVIEDNFSDFSDDVEVLQSRLYDDSYYDPAIIGTTVNSSGKRVIVYDDERLLDLVEDRLVREREESGDPIDESERRSAADDFLHYKLSDYLYYARPHAPVIVFEPREEISHYEKEGFEIYESGGQLLVGESKVE